MTDDAGADPMTADGTPAPQVGDTITTAEALDALPVGSGFVDKFGDLGLVDEPRRVQYAQTAHLSTAYVAGHYLPATVLFRPDAPQPTDDPAVVRVVARLLALGSDITPDMQALANRGKWQALWTNLRNDLRAAVSDLRAALAAAGAVEAEPCPSCGSTPSRTTTARVGTGARARGSATAPR